jgi:hypothetical protein
VTAERLPAGLLASETLPWIADPGGMTGSRRWSGKAQAVRLGGDMALLTLGQSFDESAQPGAPAQPPPPAGPAPGRKPRRTARPCATARG